ncbi:MAG: nitroreductase [Candidatus Latescibacteria bacterium]|nr:nitroreductase [Candidatus Latescibacterota bacterium]
MNQTAQTAHPIHPLLSRRWSPHAFADRPVESTKLIALLEAARWAPSSSNRQPWHFIVAEKQDRAEFNRLLDCLKPGNQSWAGQAPVLMLGVARQIDEGGSTNRHAFYDVGQAVAHMTIQALDQGLYMRQMGGFDVAKAQRDFAIPQDFEPTAAIALGYPAAAGDLTEELRQKEQAPRARKPLVDFVFAGQWGQTASLVASET